jgi:hypothetical protein
VQNLLASSKVELEPDRLSTGLQISADAADGSLKNLVLNLSEFAADLARFAFASQYIPRRFFL